MKQAPKHGKKVWINQHGVAIPREHCNNPVWRSKKQSKEAKQAS